MEQGGARTERGFGVSGILFVVLLVVVARLRAGEQGADRSGGERRAAPMSEALSNTHTKTCKKKQATERRRWRADGAVDTASLRHGRRAKKKSKTRTCRSGQGSTTRQGRVWVSSVHDGLPRAPDQGWRQLWTLHAGAVRPGVFAGPQPAKLGCARAASRLVVGANVRLSDLQL